MLSCFLKQHLRASPQSRAQTVSYDSYFRDFMDEHHLRETKYPAKGKRGQSNNNRQR